MVANLNISGTKTSGESVRAQNTTAVLTLANILKTSLGPQGLDKMLVDELGELTITNDGATILSNLEVEHPAAKVMVDLSKLKDSEVGDGTTSVCLLACELLKRGNDLVKQKIHPTTVIQGYRMAMKEAIKYTQSYMAVKISDVEEDLVMSVARTTLSSKLIGAEGDRFTTMVVDAVRSIKMHTSDNKIKYPINQISIVKSHGRSSAESRIIPNGYCIPLGRSAQGMPMVVKNAKIACLDFPLHKFKMYMGVEVKVSSADELEKIRQRELDLTKEKIDKILASGANVIFTTKGIDDLAAKYLVQAGALGVRRVDGADIKRIAKCTGASVQITMGDMDGDEAFSVDDLGTAECVYEERVGDNQFIFIDGAKSSKSTTVLLRGANEYMLEEMERSVHDALCAVSRTLESAAVVPGGGAVETAVSLHLEEFALKQVAKEQLAIEQFAEALLMIPKQLAFNAALDSAEMLADLRSAQSIARDNKDTDKQARYAGLDLLKGTIRNCLADGVVEPLVGKLKQFKFACEAAITVLRIDDFIQLDPPKEQQAPGQR